MRCNSKILIWFILLFLSTTMSIYGAEGKDLNIVKFLGFHAHRYQNFESSAVSCEIFGEMENLGAKDLKGVRVKVDLLDEKNKIVYSEEIELLPRIIIYGNPKGVERPLKRSEVGVFNLDMKECPPMWLEGKIRYKLIDALTEE